MTECTIGNLIESLEKFPKDKPVKILALGIENDCSDETINSVDYPQVNYDGEIDERGNQYLLKKVTLYAYSLMNIVTLC